MLATVCCLQAAIILRKTPNDQSHVTTCCVSIAIKIDLINILYLNLNDIPWQ